MDVYKRTDGRSPFWQYDIVLPNGTRQRLSIKERDKARARKVMVAALGDAKLRADAPPASPRLWDALGDYIDHLDAHGKVCAREARTIRAKMFGAAQFASAGRYALPAAITVAEVIQAC